jgi:hypothetical protein
MLKRVLQLRANAAGERKDAFDIIGQFMQEYNHQLIVFREETNRKGIPQLPVPDNACIRLDLKWDAKHPVLPGSRIYINTGILAKWLMRTKDTPRRLAAELKDAGALIRERDRVSMYKGCGRENPGQAHCMILDAMHPRFAQSFTSASATPQTAPALAILQGGA